MTLEQRLAAFATAVGAAIKNKVYQHRRLVLPLQEPTPASLLAGEVFLNTNDGFLWTLNDAGELIDLSQQRRRSWALLPGANAFAPVGTQAPTTVGTVGNNTVAVTNRFTASRAVTLLSAATVGALASARTAQNEFFRGTVAGLGGFYNSYRFGLTTTVAPARGFFGLADTTTAPTNIDPFTSTTPGRVGLGFNESGGNWRLISCNSGAAPTLLDLGANFSVVAGHLLELQFFAKAAGASIFWRARNYNTGGDVTGELTANIPAANTFLSPRLWMTNNTSAAAVAFQVVRIYAELPY